MSDLNDHILKMDRKQGLRSEEAVICPTDKDHGRLSVHATGAILMCAKCGYQAPIGIA